MAEVSWLEGRLTALARRLRYWASMRRSTIAGRPPLPADDGSVYKYMFEKGCPVCRGKPRWMKGPEGGMSVNIFCGHCGEGWNVTPLLERAEKIGKNLSFIESPATQPFTCSECGAVSYSIRDKQEGYCGRCHKFTRKKGRR